MKTAAVIGGGFVGAACAWQLLRAGFQVSLFDSGDFESAASWGNAGHLAVEQIEPLASITNLLSLPKRLSFGTNFAGRPVAMPVRDIAHWLPFGLKLIAASSPARFAKGKTALASLLSEAMPAWQRLALQTGTQQHLRADGHFVAWESPKHAASGKHQMLTADIGTARAQAATADEISELRNNFNQRPIDAVHIQNSGQILDLAQARRSILAALQAHGATVHATHAKTIAIENEQAVIHLGDGNILRPNLAVVAAGIGSATLLRGIEGAIPLIAERGYHLEAASTRNPHALPPVAFAERSVIVTQFAASLRIAGFTEFSTTQSPPDTQKWQTLSRHAAELGLPFNADAARWIGARPTLPDYLPAIGRSRRAQNLLYAFGHQHLGLTLAAITGELVAAMATTTAAAAAATPTINLSPFDLQRFQ